MRGGRRGGGGRARAAGERSCVGRRLPSGAEHATHPVDGALIAGINGSKALVRHACIAQLLQLGQIDETDKSDSRAAGARTCSRLEHPRPYAA